MSTILLTLYPIPTVLYTAQSRLSTAGAGSVWTVPGGGQMSAAECRMPKIHSVYKYNCVVLKVDTSSINFRV